MEYTVIRSNRRTLSAEIRGGALVVRAPLRATDAEIQRFVDAHSRWIKKHMAPIASSNAPKLSPDELNALAAKAHSVIPERVAYFAPLVGVTYGRVTIRCQKTRWGSCSTKGNLNFNCLLMLTPPEVLDSVVVHELCHRLEMNHSERFYREVLRVYPEYNRWNRWLKEHGAEIMARNG